MKSIIKDFKGIERGITMTNVYQVFLDTRCKLTTASEEAALEKAEELALAYDCFRQHRLYILKSCLETQLEPELLELCFTDIKLKVDEVEPFEMLTAVRDDNPLYLMNYQVSSAPDEVTINQGLIDSIFNPTTTEG